MAQSPRSSDVANTSSLIQRRIRHITAVQIRNLTPFPVRDAFASALTQPAEQSQFTSYGHLSDDLDVAMLRKRTRRVSSNSVATHLSLRSDDGIGEDGYNAGGVGERGRRISGSRVSASSDGNHPCISASTSAGRPYSTSGSAPTIRPHRPRTSSITSSIGSRFSSPSGPAFISPGDLTSASGASFTAMLPDNSQTGLEMVIQSRLVETFLAITVPSTLSDVPSGEGHASPRPQSSPRRRASPTLHSAPVPLEPSIPLQNGRSVDSNSARRSNNKLSPIISPNKATASRRDPHSSSKSVLSRMTSAHTKPSSVSILRQNGKVKDSPSLPPLKNHSSRPLERGVKPSLSLQEPLPNYLSPIHRPSTNPFFPIDARSDDGFTTSTDCSGQIMKIEIWGKVGAGWQKGANGPEKGKEKENEHLRNDSDIEWKILDDWLIDLADLVPLPDDLTMHPSQLPSNTLLVTLSPPGKTFYLPPPHIICRRSPTPSAGYTSDPESEVRKAKRSGDSFPSVAGELVGQSDNVVALMRRRHRGGTRGVSSASRDTSRTAGWQDIFKLVTLQSCILDNETSLIEVVNGIDRVLESDTTSLFRREISEREARLEELRVNLTKAFEESEQLKLEIRTRSEKLKQRKGMLSLAKEQHKKGKDSELEMESKLVQNRAQHLSLTTRFGPTRTTLLTILSTIYPIELFSPPDLLYTILDVPLPIPLSSSHPAPPLTLPAHKALNEDAVATSLGFAAQVVQLLAAYLGKGLVYPVTCIGSRSLIRDGISAMVGPRMFPLFSKGVDTYRFEYGVFLLNKDIELLMADRELRALDMRHTLPNLKNLLLTLTDEEDTHLKHTRPPDSPISLVSGLQSPLRADSPVEPNSSTPKATINADLPAEGSTPPASGSTTPTATDASKKTRPFLGLSPLTDFFRVRYPSSSLLGVKGVSETSEELIQQGTERTHIIPRDHEEQDGADEDEDRRTIHDVVRDGDMEALMERKKPIQDTNPAPEANGVGQEHREKLNEGNSSPPLGTSPVSVTHT